LQDPLHAGLAEALALLRGGDRPGAETRLAGLLDCPGEHCLAETAPLTTLAEKLSAALRWKEASLAYGLLVEAGHRGQAWIAERAAERAAVQDAFIAAFEAVPPIDRLRDELSARMGHPVAAIATRRMRPGLVGMAIYRHDVAFADGAPDAAVVEKVMRSDGRDMRRIRTEMQLFAHVAAETLMAPRHYGALESGRFVSNFQAFFDGAPLPIEAWIGTYESLLYRYWALVPPATLGPRPSLVPAYLDHLRDLAAGQVPAAVQGHLRRHSADDVAMIVARRLDDLTTLLRAMPVFVFHDDMHTGNILVGRDGGMTIIDWDSWALAPIGTGWRFYSPEDPMPEPDVARIAAARPLPAAVTGPALMLMASLWGWHKALRDRKPELAARWLEKLLRLA
jgi:hypothetical protein